MVCELYLNKVVMKNDGIYSLLHFKTRPMFGIYNGGYGLTKEYL